MEGDKGAEIFKAFKQSGIHIVEKSEVIHTHSPQYQGAGVYKNTSHARRMVHNQNKIYPIPYIPLYGSNTAHSRS